MRAPIIWPKQRFAPVVMAVLGVGWLLLLITFGSSDLVSWGARSAWSILRIALIGVGLYLVPGLATLQLLWRDRTLPWASRLALACAIGVALPPLLLEFASLIHLPWNRAATLGYLVLALIVLAYPWLSRRKPWALRRDLQISWHDWMFVGLIGLALVVRLYVVRAIPVGLWGDSYHHTMITQLLVDNRGLFSSWAPYAPLVTFTYHYGFHANAAFFHWASGIPVNQSVVLVGQLLGTATLPLAYLLTTSLSGNRYAGLWAVALTGFINTMPVYYVNWGRYTQLTGQIILPAVLVCWMAVIEHERLSWRSAALVTLLTASLLLTHYVVTLFAAICVGAYLIVWIILHRAAWSLTRRTLVRALAIGFASVIVALPWLINTLFGNLVRNVAGTVDQGARSEAIAAISSLGALTPFYLKSSILLLACCGLIIAGIYRAWRVALAALWTLLLILLIVPHLVGLPGTGVVKTFAVYIALYLTVVPLAAYALAIGQHVLLGRRPGLSAMAMGSALMLISVWGAQWQQHLLNPVHQLVMPADMQAMDWIKSSTPPDAKFLVNMFPAFNNSLVVGSDAGWWIPLLTGRLSTLPPVTYGSERAASSDYAARINALAFALRDHPLPSEEGLRLIRAAGIGYIYHGAQVGKDGQGQDVRMDIEALRRHAAFRVVYERAGVTIFALEPAP